MVHFDRYMNEMELELLCRICLGNSNNYSNIFISQSDKNPLYQIINYVYDLEITLDDGLPEYVCLECLEIMKRFENCKRNAHKAKSKLISMREKKSISLENEIDNEEWYMPEDLFTKAQSSDGTDSFEEEVTNLNYPEKQEENKGVSIDNPCSGSLRESAVSDDMSGIRNCDLPKVVKIPNNRRRGRPKTSRPDSFICDVCKKGFYCKSALGVHVRSHYDEKPYVCNVCKKGFKTPQSCRLHGLWHKKNEIKAKNNSKQKVFKCKMCGNQYTNYHSLYGHTMVHKKKFPCVICKRGCCSKAELARHLLTHSKERPFVCGDCGKSFTRKSHLKEHMAFHSDVRPFKCSKCGKSFKTKCNLNYHDLIHFK